MSDREQYLKGMIAGLKFALGEPDLAREAVEIAHLELMLLIPSPQTLENGARA